MATSASPSKPSPTTSSGKSQVSTSSGKSQATSQSTGSGKQQGEEGEDYSGLEGAVGFTPPAENVKDIPEWNQGDSTETDPEVSEMRRRRLERFSSANEHQGEGEKKNTSSDEFD